MKAGTVACDADTRTAVHDHPPNRNAPERFPDYASFWQQNTGVSKKSRNFFGKTAKTATGKDESRRFPLSG